MKNKARSLDLRALRTMPASPRVEARTLDAPRQIEDFKHTVEQALLALRGAPLADRGLLVEMPVRTLYDLSALALLSRAAREQPSEFARLHFRIDLRLVLADGEHLARVQRETGAAGLRLATEIGIDAWPRGAELEQAGVSLLLVPERDAGRSSVGKDVLEHARYVAAFARAQRIEAAADAALAALVPAIDLATGPWAGIEAAQALVPTRLH